MSYRGAVIYDLIAGAVVAVINAPPLTTSSPSARVFFLLTFFF
jgi:hypothetical protein